MSLSQDAIAWEIAKIIDPGAWTELSPDISHLGSASARAGVLDLHYAKISTRRIEALATAKKILTEFDVQEHSPILLPEESMFPDDVTHITWMNEWDDHPMVAIRAGHPYNRYWRVSGVAGVVDELTLKHFIGDADVDVLQIITKETDNGNA